MDNRITLEALRQHAKGQITYGVPVDTDTIIVDGNTFTKVAAAPGAGEFSNIAELVALIEAVAGINASAAGGVITVNADAIGTAGNAKTLALGAGNTGTMAISGPTLTGGVAATYTEAVDLGGEFSGMDSVINLTALTGGATLTATPQVSLDKEVWIDRTATAALAAVAATELAITNPLRYFRWKIVLGGTSPVVSGSLTAATNAT